MDDADIVRHIQELADEEHALERAHEGSSLSRAERDRLRGIEVALDQCWDLLRQRRARRDAGQDPDGTTVRPEEVVERYQQYGRGACTPGVSANALVVPPTSAVRCRRETDRLIASGSWARTDRRARWRSLTVIAVVAGVTAGLVFASLAGAWRTNTSFERLREQTRGADAAVFSSQVGQIHPDWSKLATRPEVESLAPWYLLFGTSPGESAETVMFGAVDGNWLHAVDRVILRAGRMYDPRADDEIVIDEEQQCRSQPAMLIHVARVPFGMKTSPRQ